VVRSCEHCQQCNVRMDLRYTGNTTGWNADLQGFRLLVGRAQRIVEGTDALPQFPPLSDFTPTPWGRWISVRVPLLS
jgi:hypothetical protein